MAFEQLSIKWPRLYIKVLKEMAGKSDESQGYLLQQAFYEQMKNKLPPPKRRDR